MANVSASATIKASVQEVYDFAATPSRTPMFVPNLSENTELSTETTEVGQTWTWRYNLLGIDLSGKGETTVADAPNKWQLKTTGDAETCWTYTYEADGDGTKVTIDVDYELPAGVLSKVNKAQAILDSIQQKTAESVLENLKTILED